MKLYTKTGDDGGTGLFDGARVSKCDERVCAYGEVDELNAFLGAAIASANAASTIAGYARLAERMSSIQNALFAIGAELATPIDSRNRAKVKAIPESLAKELEAWIDEACAPVAELKSFVLPGGSPLAAQMHICRTVCRRAERSVVSLGRSQELNPQIVIYLNRLSDLFFAWARLANHAAGIPDVEWHP